MIKEAPQKKRKIIQKPVIIPTVTKEKENIQVKPATKTANLFKTKPEDPMSLLNMSTDGVPVPSIGVKPAAYVNKSRKLKVLEGLGLQDAPAQNE